MATQSNLYKAFLGLLPQRPLQVGTVTAVADGLVTLDLPGGASIKARGTATVGQLVFVRDGVVEGVAEALSIVTIDV